MMAKGVLQLKDLETEGDDPVTIFMRAKLLEKAKDFEAAIAEYSKVLATDPNFVNAAYSKAACENLIGRYEDAIVTYEAAFKRDFSEADREKTLMPNSPYSPSGKVDKTPNLLLHSGFNTIKIELIDVEEKPVDDEMTSYPHSKNAKKDVSTVNSFADLTKYERLKLSIGKGL